MTTGASIGNEAPSAKSNGFGPSTGESAGTSKMNVICSDGPLDETLAEYWISFAGTLVEECHLANLDIHFKCGAFETIVEARSKTVLPILLFLAELDPHALHRHQSPSGPTSL